MQKLFYGVGLLVALGLVACGSDQKEPVEPDGPMESAGEEVDEAAEDTAEATDEAAEDVEEEVEEAAEETEEAME